LKREETYKPKVSIIIPAYNSEKLIGRCIESALNQTLKEIEVIVIDDLSQDSTKSIIESYAKKDSRVIGIYSKENHGAGYSRNVGIDRASGEFIGFIDSDDYVDPGWFEYLYSNSKDLDNVHGIRVIHDFGKRFRISKVRPYGCIIPSIIRKSFLIEKGLRFPESRDAGEDTLFNVKLRESKPRKKRSPDNGIYYHYVKREGSLSGYINKKSKKQRRVDK